MILRIRTSTHTHTHTHTNVCAYTCTHHPTHTVQARCLPCNPNSTCRKDHILLSHKNLCKHIAKCVGAEGSRWGLGCHLISLISRCSALVASCLSTVGQSAGFTHGSQSAHINLHIPLRSAVWILAPDPWAVFFPNSKSVPQGLVFNGISLFEVTWG